MKVVVQDKRINYMVLQITNMIEYDRNKKKIPKKLSIYFVFLIYKYRIPLLVVLSEVKFIVYRTVLEIISKIFSHALFSFFAFLVLFLSNLSISLISVFLLRSFSSMIDALNFFAYDFAL